MHPMYFLRTRLTIGSLVLGWLAVGCAILLLAPHSVHNETLGWSASYWLIAVPLFGMLAMRGSTVRPEP